MDSDGKLTASLPAPSPASAPPGNGSSNVFSQARPMHGRTSGPTRRSTRGQWTPEEDEILCKAVQRFKGKNWKKIAECFKDRTDVQCLHRWQKVLNPELIKGPWSKEEDEIIVQLVNKYGPKKWSTIAQHLPGRIGKQCRERWHNHLNPAINKEAWTQEEELVLIRAHQIHGNRWAELTKFLPGRTDNAIKNHWNSSVKKKLDSYIASGLLAQFQGLPMVGHQNQSMPAASLRVQQSSGDGSFFKDGAEAEEISECSQVGCSQTASDMSNTGCQMREDFVLSEESEHGKVQNTSPLASCSEQYYTSLDDMTFTIPDIPCEFSCSSKYLDENFTKDPGDCGARECNFGEISLPSISSFELVTDSSSLPGNYFLVDPNHHLAPGPSHQSTAYSAAASDNNVGTDADVPGPRTEEGCSKAVSPEEAGDACPSTKLNICSSIIDMDRYREYMSFQSIYQFSETDGTTALEPYNSLHATLMESSNCDSLPSEVPVGNNLMMCSQEINQINDSVTVSQGKEVVANAEEGFVHEHNNSSSPCHDHIDVGLTEQTDMIDSSRLVPVNTFGSEAVDPQQTCPATDEQQMDPKCEQEAGSLCYEPPRFPSLDIPFFSCDLAQPGTDAQQEFSPLGIRQLMMSSTNSLSLTPFKLWDSPSSDDSPDAVLKSAAKTFACTPSILKKRHRDLLSPLSPFSERRYDKKTGNDVRQGFLCTSRLTKEFSRLDVIFDEADQCKKSASSSHDQKDHPKVKVEDKENICPDIDGQREDAKESHAESRDRNSEEVTNEKVTNSTGIEGILEAHSKKAAYKDRASETSRGVLVERHLNDAQFSSPDGIRTKGVLDTSDGATEVDSLKSASKQGTVSESVTCTAASVLSPPSFEQRKRNSESTVLSGQPVSAVTSVIVDSLINEVGAENLNIFGGTPFRRSIESPSAWKSPWYFSSLVNCPRFDTDLTVEDIGIFMSPGERSFDAIGLMKQINEQGADAFADAKEVLGSETPESILRQRGIRNQNPEEESNNATDSQHEGRLHLASNVSTERRILDFSECGTPSKAMEKGKGVSDARLSSPPSCLLKSYR